MTDAAKSFALVTVASVVQVAFVDQFELVEGHADVLLLALLSVGLLRGPVFGAALGFWAGLLVDVATFGTLGLTSLVLTLCGYWAGRIGEATSNHEHQCARVLLTTLLLTVGAAIAALLVHLFLGQSAPVGALIVRSLLPSLLLNLLLAVPAYRLVRALLPPAPRREREVAPVV